jgi:hypothetical protein
MKASSQLIDKVVGNTPFVFCILAFAFVIGVIIVSSNADIYAQNATLSTPANNTIPGANMTRSSPSPLQNLTIDHAGGGFTSLQVDSSNKTWITTGTWDLVSNPSSLAQSGSLVNFNATIISRDTDGSGEHEHKISDFKLMNRSINSGSDGSEIVFNGTGSVETDVGLYSDVPISIRITDKAPAIISIDTQSNKIEPKWIPGGGTIGLLIDERVEDHFGYTPIYGNVKRG